MLNIRIPRELLRIAVDYCQISAFNPHFSMLDIGEWQLTLSLPTEEDIHILIRVRPQLPLQFCAWETWSGSGSDWQEWNGLLDAIEFTESYFAEIIDEVAA